MTYQFVQSLAPWGSSKCPLGWPGLFLGGCRSRVGLLLGLLRQVDRRMGSVDSRLTRDWATAHRSQVT